MTRLLRRTLPHTPIPANAPMTKRARSTRRGAFTGGVAECSPCCYRAPAALTVASVLSVQMSATAPPWLCGHGSRRRPSSPVAACHSCSIRFGGLVRCEDFGQGGMCHSSPIGLPR